MVIVMGRRLNKETILIRNIVSGWLNRVNPDTFTVPIILSDVGSLLKESFRDLDLSKALSNELIRREQDGWLICVGRDIVGLGRPPKVYKQRYRNGD